MGVLIDGRIEGGPSPLDQLVISVFSAASTGGAPGGPGIEFAAWPEADLAVYVPFRVAIPMIAVKLFCYNGAGAGNLDVGLYDRNGRRLVSVGGVAKQQDVVQVFDIADTLLEPGLYYLAMASDGVTSFSMGMQAAHFQRAAGLVQQSAAYPLPAQAAFAAMTYACCMPCIGLTTKLVV